MRRLILVEDFSSTRSQLLRWLTQTNLPTTPVIAIDAPLELDETPGPPDDAPVETLADLPGQGFAVADVSGMTILAAHPGGAFPERLSERTRMLLAACDTVVARCPKRDFVSAAQFYSTHLYALDGQFKPAEVRTATAHLLGLIDRARNQEARRRHDLIDGFPPGRAYGPTEDVQRSSNVERNEAAIETTVFETAYGELSTELARVGFEYAPRKVRETPEALTILAGSPGIALYGPYVALEAGDYRYRLECDGGGRDLAFTLEAAWNAGGQALAVHRYAFAEGPARALADLCFSVSGPAVGRAIELRLWNDEACGPFDLVRLSLVRFAAPW